MDRNIFWLKPLLISVLVIGLAASLLVGGYLLGQKGFRLEIIDQEAVSTSAPEATPNFQLRATLSPQTESEETAGWETYTNSQYGYQFKHPQGWIFKTSAIGDETKPLYVIRETIQSQDVDDYLVSVKVWDNPDKHSLAAWLQFMKDSGALALPAEDVELAVNTSVGGEPAFKIWSDPLSKGQEPGKCFQACPILSVYFVHGDKAYEAEHVYMREVDETSQTVFSQLLSTFQFLE